MKHLVSLGIIVIIIIFGSLTGCDKEESNPDVPLISVIDVSQESEWDYWVISQEGDYLLIKEAYSYPIEIYYKHKSMDQGYLLSIDDKGMPDKLFVEDYIFQYGNFRGNLVDVGIIYPDGSVNIVRDIETEINWDEFTLKSIQLNWTRVVKIGSQLAGVAICIGSVSLALTATAGIALPLAITGCAATVASIGIDYLLPNDEILGLSAEGVGVAVSGIGCFAGGAADCFYAGATVAAAVTSFSADQIEKMKDEIRVVEAALEYGYGDIQITLTWDNTSDLDLHVIDPYGEEIYWRNTTSSSGGKLDVDNVDGYGPENIFWEKGKAPNGLYTVYVHHYDWRGYAAKPLTSNFTVLINAFDKILNKKYTETVSVHQDKPVANFDQNGLKSAVVFEFEITTDEDKKNYYNIN